MATFSISGRMSVKTVKKNFIDAFGGSLRILKDGKPADDGATMASLKADGCKGGELELKGNTKVAGMKKKIADLYGISVEVYAADGKKPVDDGLTLASIGAPQAAAPAEKPTEKKEAKVQPAKEPKEKPVPKAAPAQPTATGFSFDQLLDAALADGVVTDKERAILLKKATAQGYDPDEVELIIDGRLAKMKPAQPIGQKQPKSEDNKTNVSNGIPESLQKEIDQLKANPLVQAAQKDKERDFHTLENAWKQHQFGDDSQAIKTFKEYAMNNSVYREVACMALYLIYKESGKYNEARTFGLLFYKSQYGDKGIPTRVIPVGSIMDDVRRKSNSFQTLQLSDLLKNMCEELFRKGRKNEAIRFFNENKQYLIRGDSMILKLEYNM